MHHDEEINNSPRPETSLNIKRPFTDEGARRKIIHTKINSPQEQHIHNRNAATAANYKAVKLPSNSHQIMEEMGFSEKKMQEEKERRAFNMMPPVKTINNFIGMKNSLYKSMPRNMTLDKERLYEENLTLKSILNTLKKENLQLKTKLTSLDRENYKYEKIIYDTDYLNNKKGVKTQYYLSNEFTNPTIHGLKKQLKETQNSLALKEKEAEFLKKAPKLTRIQELETELKSFAEESVRLRKMLDETIAFTFPENKGPDFKLEEQMLLQASALTALNKERVDLITMIQNLNDQLMRKGMKIEDLENQLSLYRNDKFRKNFQIKKVNNQANQSQNVSKKQQKQITNEKDDMKINLEQRQQEETLKKEIEQKNNDISSLSVKLAQKDKKISELERKIKEINSDFSEKLEIESKEKSSLSTKLDKERKEHKILIQKYNSLLGSKQNEKEYDEEKPDLPHEKSLNSSKLIAITPPLPEKKKLQKVNFYDIEDIGIMLKYNLKLRQIPFSDINSLFKEDQNGSELSISELSGILSDEPFCLKNEEKRILISRYMIEDNSLDYILYDEKLTANIMVIRSVFKKILGNYTLFSKKQCLNFHSDISSLLNRVKPTLIDTLKATAIKKGGNMNNKITTKEDLLACLKFCEINLDKNQIDYFLMKLWEGENSLEAFSIEKIFAIFDSSHIIKEEKEIVVEDDKNDNFDNFKSTSHQKLLNFDQELPSKKEKPKILINESNKDSLNKKSSLEKKPSKENNESKEKDSETKNAMFSQNDQNKKKSLQSIKEVNSNIFGAGENTQNFVSHSNMMEESVKKSKEINNTQKSLEEKDFYSSKISQESLKKPKENENESKTIIDDKKHVKKDSTSKDNELNAFETKKISAFEENLKKTTEDFQNAEENEKNSLPKSEDNQYQNNEYEDDYEANYEKGDDGNSEDINKNNNVDNDENQQIYGENLSSNEKNKDNSQNLSEKNDLIDEQFYKEQSEKVSDKQESYNNENFNYEQENENNEGNEKSSNFDVYKENFKENIENNEEEELKDRDEHESRSSVDNVNKNQEFYDEENEQFEEYKDENENQDLNLVQPNSHKTNYTNTTQGSKQKLEEFIDEGLNE